MTGAFVFVVVVGSLEVGRTGASTVRVDDNSGQTSRPQARFVGQQPPPSDTGQDRKPEEQSNVLERVDVIVILVVVPLRLCDVGDVVADAAEEEETVTVDDDGAETMVVVIDEVCVAVGAVLEDGMMITVAVELSRQPPVTQAYPGTQQPPPG